MKSFACLLRQEVAYFDRPENNSGTICARLSSDASALQEMIGIRLGVIFEVLAISFFGIIFGFFLSWQLTLILCVHLFLLCITAYGAVRLRLWLKQQSAYIVGKANAVGLCF